MIKMESNKIEVLTDIEHVLKRPSMYIGSTVLERIPTPIYVEEHKKIIGDYIEIVPGILKIIDEVLSNSIDEAIRTNYKFANKISIDINHKTGEVKIIDNGRGISHEKEETTGLPQAVAAFTKLKAGSNFNESENTKMGMYGVGSTLTNIFSKSFKTKTGGNGYVTKISCAHNMHEVDFNTRKNKTWQGTDVRFIPDFDYFGIDGFTEDYDKYMLKRIIDLSIIFPYIEFKYNGKKIGNITFKQYAKMHCEWPEHKPIFFEEGLLQVAILPYTAPHKFSLVNGIINYTGKHFDDFENLWMPLLREKIERKYKINVKPDVVRSEISTIMIVYVHNPKFLGQTKSSLYAYDGDTISKWANTPEIEAFVNKLMKMPVIIDPIIEQQKMKEERKRRAELKKANAKIKKHSSTKLLEALKSRRQSCALFICEGDSAVGRALETRDPETQAFLPLRGKIMNVRSGKYNNVQIAENKELQEIMSVIGLSIGTPAADKLRYGKIYIMADADYDGMNITTLLVNFFYTYWPELFDRKIIRIVQTPVVISSKGKAVKRFYSLDEFNSFATKNSGWTHKYMKGLGSLPLDEYKFAITNINEIIVTRDNAAENTLDVIFSKNVENRKDWLLKY